MSLLKQALELARAQLVQQAGVEAPLHKSPEQEPLHAKARSRDKYAERQTVQDAMVPWEVEFDSYAPPDFTDPVVFKFDRSKKAGGWADPEDFYEEDEFKERLTFHPPLCFDPESDRPRNPKGRTGLQGRGLLGKWGPNQAADPIVLRLNPVSKEPEVVLIERADSGEWG
jgi:ADP-ribose pyrophosphatase